MASSSRYVERVLASVGSASRVLDIHRYIAKHGTVSIDDLIRWYRRSNETKASYPSVVYATLSALRRKGDISRTPKHGDRSSTVTHLSPCTVQSSREK